MIQRIFDKKIKILNKENKRAKDILYVKKNTRANDDLRHHSIMYDIPIINKYLNYMRVYLYDIKLNTCKDVFTVFS